MGILKLEDDRLIVFQHSFTDYGHIIVSRVRSDKSKEIIGHIYTEISEDETRYISVNKKGREIFPPTTDFNTVEMKFERYAHLRALQERAIENNRFYNNYYSLIQNQNTMQNNQQNPEQKQKKANQLIFVEYEKAAGDGHFVTVVDSYRNVIGRIHKSYNDQSKKYEYSAYDHAGNLMSQNEKLWELKKEFTNNRDVLLEQAHQRRIESKEKAQQQSQEKPAQPAKTEERKKETEQVREKKAPEKQQSKSKAQEKGKQDKTVKDDREQELEEIRVGREDEFGDVDR